MKQTSGYAIVTFERMNMQIKLHRDEYSYILAVGAKTKAISDSLGEHIRKTYKPGQLQPNSRYS